MQLRRPLIFTLLTCLVVVAPLAVFAASRYDTRGQEDIVAGVIGTTGDGGSYDLLSGNFFKLDSNFGQDLYQIIYKKVKSEGTDMAVTRTLGKHTLTKEEIFQLIPGSNVGQLIRQEDPSKNLNATEVAKRREAIVRELAINKEFADLEALVQSDVQPTELFSNGDESDSGFDLIVDLDIMQRILFFNGGRIEGVGGDAGGNDDDNGGGPARNEGRAQQPAAGAQNQADAQQRAQQRAGQNQPNGDNGQGVQAPAQQEVICPVNPAFDSAVRDAIAQSEEEEEKKAESENNQEENTGEQNQGASGSPVGGTKPDGELVPAPASDWYRTLPCNQFFCVTLDLKYKTESSYTVQDNCIACHIEKINDAFKKTLSHNLVPNKVTGNLYEGPKCKNAFLGLFGGDILNFNFVPIAQPILTPPNDDLIVKGNIFRNMMDFYEKYYDNPGRCADKAAGGACKPDNKTSAKAAAAALALTNPGTDVGAVLKTIRSEAGRKKDEAMKELEKSRLQSEAQAHAGQYQALFSEIDTMNSYFESFQKLFIQIGDPSQPDAPCTALRTKPMCK